MQRADRVMSSQTLATSLPGGLPPSPPPAPDLPDFSPPAWSDHMNAPEQPLEDSHFSHPSSHNGILSTHRPSDSNNSEQHRQALNNLLAALAPMNASDAPPTTQPDGPAFRGDNVNVAPASANVNNHAAVTQNNHLPNPSLNTNTEHFPPLPSYFNTPSLLPPSQLPDSSNTQPAQPPLLIPPTSGLPMAPTLNDRREIEAFAKIEFEDGNYYITTWACELGRDALAFRAALLRAEEAKNNPNGRSQSSSGRVSRPSDRIRRAGDSQVQGSVVSEAGGFGGVDEQPLVRSDEKPAESGHPSHSSQVSASDVVKPQEVLYHPPLAPFDYHRNAELQAQLDPDNEQPAPVTAEHLPNADTCPLIPIHAMANSTKSEVATHKGISRRHVRIEWDSDSECFKMKVLGRNGAFLDGAFVGRGQSKRLSSGANIQISDIQMTFRLPRPKTDPISDISSQEDAEGSLADRRSTSPTSQEAEEGGKGSKKPSISLINKSTATAHLPDSLIGPDGIPILPRKRGPGRPPKDGIMSTRERKEREKAAKLAQAKAENGGRTPPPSAKAKLGKLPELPKPEPKPEKRKYNKRKREGEDADVLPSIEGAEENVGSDTERVPVKKARASKSPSPAYPPLATLTEERLARPSEPYARLIYDILAEIYPKALPLKQIYRALKMKFPFFVYRVESEGWQSSVRHNLNQEWNKLFEKGEKEGKGFAWKAILGALQPQAERKRAAQAAAAAKPKPIPRQPPHQGPPPPLNWQNNTSFPPPYWQQGQGQPPYAPQPHGLPWPQGMPHPPPGQAPPNPNIPVHQIPKPGTPQIGPAQQSPRTPIPPPSQTPQNPLSRPPQTSTPTPAAPNMPCTVDGLMAIRRFETAMYDQVKAGSNPDVSQWHLVFASVKNRLLHGANASSVPEGETREEATIMGHVKIFIERFQNPNFVGFQAPSGSGVGSRTASPAPGQAQPSSVIAESAKANSSPLAKEVDAVGKENANVEKAPKNEEATAMEGVTATEHGKAASIGASEVVKKSDGNVSEAPPQSADTTE